ncbi:DMT family transporter [Roseobacter sinensis]|uniref:DMT family transporter n=1 Tax=Roseobacter sinensis TaxID=2931391 RepID=A0ABT3BA22_9RHOB|nr:DMT family transporter [Roseobacter sp. WL0113]MCV3270279.1 DMT family transporter [Roseobacter sp. WL0113]
MAVAAGLIEDRPRFGILLMLGAWLLFSIVDTSAKWLALVGFAAFQLAFMRYFGHFVISVAVIARGGLTRDRLHTGHPGQVITRALLLITATVSNFYALNFLPLTVISAIMFSSPVIVCFLSQHFLNEQIGPWRWFAILMGFAGVLVVIRPFGAEFHWAMLLALFNAFSLALYSIMTRRLAGVVATETMQVYLGALGTAILLPLAIWSWQWPANPLQWALLIGLGVFGWGGHQLLTNAHRFGSANTLMPYTYSFMIYLTILSYLVFDHLPDLGTVLGALIIVVSGLIIWKREQR